MVNATVWVNASVVAIVVILISIGQYGVTGVGSRISGAAVVSVDAPTLDSDCSAVPRKFKVGCATRLSKDGSGIALCLPGESAVNGMCTGNGFSPVAGCPWNEQANVQVSSNGLSVACAALGSRPTGWFCAGAVRSAAICCG